MGRAESIEYKFSARESVDDDNVLTRQFFLLSSYLYHFMDPRSPSQREAQNKYPHN